VHTPPVPTERTRVAPPPAARYSGERTPVGEAPGPDAPSGSRRAATRPRRRRIGYDLLAAAVFAIAGAMFVAGATASVDGDLRVDRSGGLRAAILDRSAANAELQAEVDALSARVAALNESSDPGPRLEETLTEIALLYPQVGLTEVRGPGLTVTLDDASAPTPIPDGYTGDDYLVHQEDVQGVVNALWRGGASGVTVMGQRLVSTSAVRCVGNTVILQGRVYSPPFIIEAVGDVAAMEGALEAEPSVQFFRDWAGVVGLGYEQTRSPELVLPPYTGALSPEYAQVVS
jgi:uncharacterized protein YlxW (UPF0749 family)